MSLIDALNAELPGAPYAVGGQNTHIGVMYFSDGNSNSTNFFVQAGDGATPAQINNTMYSTNVHSGQSTDLD